MAYRATMATLITRLRGLCEAGVEDYVLAGDTYWTDIQLQDHLDGGREDWRMVPLEARPEIVADSVYDYLDYRIPAEIGRDFEEAGTGSIWAVKQSDGTVISTSSYTVNYRAGIIRFNTDQDAESFYLDCRTFNLNAAAREVWEMKAAHAVAGVDWKTDNHAISASQEYDHCMAQAERFRKLAQGIRTVKMVRTDETWQTN